MADERKIIMKKFSIVVFVILLVTGCSTADRQRYVKNIIIYKADGQYVLALKYYDFMDKQEDYEQSFYTAENIYDLGAAAMSDKIYNFRLCETVGLSTDIFFKETDKAVYLINSMRVSPCADLLFYYGENNFVDSKETIKSPLYDIILTESAVTANIPVLDDNGNCKGVVLVKNGIVTDILEYSQWQVLGMIMNTTERCGFTFRNKTLWADLSDIHTAFYLDEDVLNVVIKMTVKDRKGMWNTAENKGISDKLLASEITGIVYDLYNNIAVAANYNLHWYCRQAGYDCNDIRVKVDFI